MNPEFASIQKHPKSWGEEVWIANNELYCGKILNFKKGSEFSMHYHIKKDETWAVMSGKLIMRFFDLRNAEEKEVELNYGDTVHLKPCVPHKLIALEDSSVFEVSTQHFESDSYRIQKGDSQK